MLALLLLLRILSLLASHATAQTVGPQPASQYFFAQSLTPLVSRSPKIPFASLLPLATSRLLVSPSSLYETPFFRQSFSFPAATGWALEGITTVSDSTFADPALARTIITVWTHATEGAKISIIRNGTVDPDATTGELPRGMGYVDCALVDAEGKDLKALAAGGVAWWRNGL